MATYYVNPAIGSNANIGSSLLPWADVPYAAALADDDDVINIIAPATAPARGGLSPSNAGSSGHPITFQGIDINNKAYIVNTINVSHGQSIGNLFYNGNLDGWLSSSLLWNWSITNNVTKESSIVQTVGKNSAKFVNAGSSAIIEQLPIYLPALTAVTLSFGHRETANDYRFKFSMQDIAENKYLSADKVTWDAGFEYVDPSGAANSNGAWDTDIVQFTTNTSGSYKIGIYLPYATTSYLDNVSLTIDSATYSWDDVIGHDYKKLSPKLASPTLASFAKGSAANWTTLGMNGLSWVDKAADLATCDATPNSWFWDNVNFDLYYNPAVGETVTNLHIEVGTNRTDNRISGTGSVYINKEYIELNNLITKFSNGRGIAVAQAGSVINYCEAHYSAGINLYHTASGEVNDCRGSFSKIEDNFTAAGAGVIVTYNRSHASYGMDDGFQGIDGAKQICNYCISCFNGMEIAGDNDGFDCEGVNSAFELYHCIAYANAGKGISQGVGSGACIAKNNIAWGNNTAGAVGQKDVQGTGSDLTASNNCYADQSDWDTDVTDVTNDPLFVDAANGNFNLLPTSPCRDAGVAIAGLTTDFEGKPVPMGSAPDIGAYEFPVPSPMGLTPGLGLGGRMIPPWRRRR